MLKYRLYHISLLNIKYSRQGNKCIFIMGRANTTLSFLICGHTEAHLTTALCFHCSYGLELWRPSQTVSNAEKNGASLLKDVSHLVKHNNRDGVFELVNESKEKFMI